MVATCFVKFFNCSDIKFLHFNFVDYWNAQSFHMLVITAID